MKIIRNGQEFELTPKEMKQAYMAFSGNNRGNDIFDKIKIGKRFVIWKKKQIKVR